MHAAKVPARYDHNGKLKQTTRPYTEEDAELFCTNPTFAILLWATPDFSSREDVSDRSTLSRSQKQFRAHAIF